MRLETKADAKLLKLEKQRSLRKADAEKKELRDAEISEKELSDADFAEKKELRDAEIAEKKELREADIVKELRLETKADAERLRLETKADAEKKELREAEIADKLRIQVKRNKERYDDMIAAAGLDLQTKLASELRMANDREIYSKHAISEITERLRSILGAVKVNITSLGDQELLNLSKNIGNVNSDMNETLAKITQFVSSTGVDS